MLIGLIFRHVDCFLRLKILNNNYQKKKKRERKWIWLKKHESQKKICNVCYRVNQNEKYPT